MKKVIFFNNKGGVGKTTFSFHLGCALEQSGKNILFVDADPQCNLSSWLCSDEVIQEAWSKEKGKTVFSLYDAVHPIISGAGDFNNISPYKIADKNIWIFIGDLMLSDFESELSAAWTQVLAAQERGFRVTSAISRLIDYFCNTNDIDYVFIDIGPNLGALNRAMLLSCDNYFIPMVPDMFSLRGTQNIGRVFANWIENYQLALKRMEEMDFQIAPGHPHFSGYVLQQFNKYRKRTTKAFENWTRQIPAVMDEFIIRPLSSVNLQPYNLVSENSNRQLAEFKNYNSLIPMAQDAQKPIFDLTYSDGIVGGHMQYVRDCRNEFDAIVASFVECLK